MGSRVRHLYIHVPFCRRRCSYCDFAIAVRKAVPGARFVDAVSREIAGLCSSHDVRAIGPLDTVYLGGGTPSLLSSEHIRCLLRGVGQAFGIATDAEVTIEANPEDVRPEHADAWAAAGVNRVSLGVQSLDPVVLEWMHRSHSAETALAAPVVLRAAGIRSVSIDLIFGIPERFGVDSVEEVARVVEAATPEHVSAYGLTVEPRTALARWIERGAAQPSSPERSAREFVRLHELLVGMGYEHYEVSNYARAGHRSRHNQVYWSARPYLGVGPSAHSFDGRRRWWNVRDWAAYEARVTAGSPPVDDEEVLTSDQQRLELLYLGLRVREGVDEQASGPLSAASVTSSIDRGWLVREEGRLMATPEGWLRLDALAARLATA